MSLIIFLVLLLGCCGYALARGGAPERWAAGLQLGAFALGFPLQGTAAAIGYDQLVLGMVAIDAPLLLALTVLAHRSTRFWPLWLAGWQAAAMVGHAAKAIDPGMLASGYAIQSMVWAYPMLIATAVGTQRHRARRAAGDPDPAWKSQLS